MWKAFQPFPDAGWFQVLPLVTRELRGRVNSTM
jgi:hypothetical protein